MTETKKKVSLASLLTPSKTVTVDYPEFEGFSVQLCYLSREELVKLRSRCLSQKFNRKTRGFEESLDEEKFLVEFTEATVKGWKGLKLEYLEDLLLVDLKGQDPKEELEYSDENAKQLVENSSEFDNWLNEVVFDLDNFRTASKGKAVKETENISGT